MRHLPRSVSLLTQRIQIERAAHLELSDGTEKYQAWGAFDSDVPRIIMATQRDSEREKQTFLHENLHAMVQHLGMKWTDAEEEQLVHRLSPILLSWLRENRAAVAFIQERPS